MQWIESWIQYLQCEVQMMHISNVQNLVQHFAADNPTVP